MQDVCGLVILLTSSVEGWQLERGGVGRSGRHGEGGVVWAGSPRRRLKSQSPVGMHLPLERARSETWGSSLLRVHRPKDTAGWLAVAAAPVALIGLAVLVLGLVNDSDLWLLGLGICSIASLTSAAAVLRMQTRGRPRRRP